VNEFDEPRAAALAPESASDSVISAGRDDGLERASSGPLDAPRGPVPADDASPERIRAARTRIADRAKALGRAAKVFAPLGRDAAFDDLGKLRKAFSKFEPKVPEAAQDDPDVLFVLGGTRAFLDGARDRIRKRLGPELQAACKAAGLSLRVISKEEPIEVRVAPFSVVVDFDKGRAELRFAKNKISDCPARADAILEARSKALERLEKDFDPQKFFDRCHRAWTAARAVGGERGERVEILEFLPYLALEMQGSKFRVDPIGQHWADYGRVRFAYDVLRLRRERMLTRGGLRLNLGVATGTTASEKKRVIYFEDEEGNGEYKLTVFFTRVEEAVP
jgi:hypothetical protein